MTNGLGRTALQIISGLIITGITVLIGFAFRISLQNERLSGQLERSRDEQVRQARDILELQTELQTVRTNQASDNVRLLRLELGK